MLKKFVLLLALLIIIPASAAQAAARTVTEPIYTEAVRYPNSASCKYLGGNATYHVGRIKSVESEWRNIWDCWTQTTTKRVLLARKIDATSKDSSITMTSTIQVVKSTRITKAGYGYSWSYDVPQTKFGRWVRVPSNLYIAGTRPTKVSATIFEHGPSGWTIASYDYSIK